MARAKETQRVNDLLEANAALQRLASIGQEITASLDSSAVFAALDNHVHAMLDAYTMAIYQPNAMELEMVFGVENNQVMAPHKININDETSIVAWCARHRQETVFSDFNTASRMCAPLIVGDKLLGVMSIQTLAMGAYGEREQAIFKTLCAYSAIALANIKILSELSRAQDELIKKNRELEKMATEDSLTGLFNRRFLDLTLQQQFSVAERYGNSLAVILIDVDHFKKVNDSFGHQIGDEVLISFAKLLQGRARDSDIVGRWGGEEFLILCPRSNLTDAALIAEKLRKLIEEHASPRAGICTASFGVAQYRAGESVSMLIARADRSLYIAKSQGRNQVVAKE